jgi:hypothetical protein
LANKLDALEERSIEAMVELGDRLALEVEHPPRLLKGLEIYRSAQLNVRDSPHALPSPCSSCPMMLSK